MIPIPSEIIIKHNEANGWMTSVSELYYLIVKDNKVLKIEKSIGIVYFLINEHNMNSILPSHICNWVIRSASKKTKYLGYNFYIYDKSWSRKIKIEKMLNL